MNNDNIENEGEFSLYTETIVQSPLEKYKKQIAILRGVAAGAVLCFVIFAVAMLVQKLTKKEEVENYIPRTPLTLEKDEYSIYGRSPSMETEEPDISRIQYWINAIIYNVSRSILYIGEDTVGVVIGESDGDYVILTENHRDWADENYYISISDEVTIPATVIRKDADSGIALLAVKKSAVTEAGKTPDVVKAGNSYGVKQNDIVIALGRVQSNAKGYAAGYVKENNTLENDVDISYDILETNIELKEDDYALIFGVNANLIGISHVTKVGDEIRRKVIGISSVKTLIEEMSSGIPAGSMGIKCTNITKDISEQFNFPEGIYVTEVEVDSPAYKAGLQAGDIIYEYNGGAVGAVQDFSDMILMSEKGDSVTIKLKRTGRGGEYRELEYTVKMGLRLD